MHPEYEHKIDTEREQKLPHTIKYSELVAAVQLSVARLLNMDKTMDAESFASLLEQAPSDEERQHMENEVGAYFDEALVDYVVGSNLHRDDEEIIISTGNDKGLGANGYYPWEELLMARWEMLRQRGLAKATLRIVGIRMANDVQEAPLEEELIAA